VASAANAIAIGTGDAAVVGASATAADAIALGRHASAGHSRGVAIGQGAATSAANQIVLGVANDLIVGAGVNVLEEMAPFSGAGTLAVGAGVGRFRFPFPATIIGVTAAVNTAPVGAAIILDVDKNGTTIFTTQANRPSIADGANATASEAVPDVTSMSAGDYLTVDRDQVGSTAAGADLTVFIRYRRT
jgi:hypothetical protein